MPHTAEFWKDLLQSHFPDFLDHAAPDLALRLQPERAAFPDPDRLFDGLPSDLRRPFLLAAVPIAGNPDESLLLHILPWAAGGGGDPRQLGPWLAALHTHLTARHAGPVLQLVFEPATAGCGRWLVLPQ